MPVYQQYTPGLGDALSDAMDTYRGVKRQKLYDTLAAQRAADEHRGAGDTHTASEIGNAVNYGFLPPGVTPSITPSPVMRGPVAAPMPSANANGLTPEALGQAFQGGPPGARDAETTADTNQPVRSSVRNQVGQQLVQAMGARGPAQRQAVQNSVNDGGSDFQQTFAALGGGIPSQRITLPGGGTIDPMAGFARQLYLRGMEKNIDTQGQIDVARGTGVLAKNTAEAGQATRAAARLQLGDPGYSAAMGQVAGAEAGAKLPADIELAVRRGEIDRANGLALAHQRTTDELNNALKIGDVTAAAALEKQRDQQRFEAGQLPARQAGELATHNAETLFTQGGQIIPRLVRGVFGWNDPSPAAATAPAAPAPSPSGGAAAHAAARQPILRKRSGAIGAFDDLVPRQP